MKAIILREYGQTDVLKQAEITTPQIQSHEILVKVRYAGVSPFDLHVRAGWFKDSINYRWPIILGWEISGDVVAVGNKVKTFKIGDAIFAHPSVYHNGGGYAEYVAIKESDAAVKPKDVRYEDAAAASMNALTAWQALFDKAHLSQGQKILIHAAAGGVGHIAVQLAKWAGAYVIGTASASNKDYLFSMGLDEFIDYKATDFERKLKDIDVVLDTIGNETLLKSFTVMKENGTVVSIVDFENIKKAKDYNVRGENVIVTPNNQQLNKIADLLSRKILHPHIAAIFPMNEVEKAHQLVESGHVRGKVLLRA